MLTSFRGISLRQVFEQDLPFVFRLYTDPARNHLWSQSRRVFDERQFLEAWNSWMNMVFAARFIVERGGRPIGRRCSPRSSPARPKRSSGCWRVSPRR
jgi:hypothetical protein